MDLCLFQKYSTAPSSTGNVTTDGN